MNHPSTVSVFGTGAVGGALTDLIHKSDLFSLRSVWNTNASECKIFSQETTRIEKPGINFPEDSDQLGNLIFLAVPDDCISDTARRLCSIEMDWRGYAVIHLSGSLSDDVLDCLSKIGAKTASMHPLQTFTRGDKADRFNEVWFTLQGNDELYPVLEELIHFAGAHSNILSANQKAGMHLAAVFASNYLVSLMNVVDEITVNHHIENGLKMMEPIVRQTILNVFSQGPENSLSGPVTRGDASTIRNHLSKLKSDVHKSQLYVQLGYTAVDIARSSGQLDDQKAEMIKKILRSNKHGGKEKQ